MCREEGKGRFGSMSLRRIQELGMIEGKDSWQEACKRIHPSPSPSLSLSPREDG